MQEFERGHYSGENQDGLVVDWPVGCAGRARAVALAYAFDLTGNYTVAPLLTVGDEMPRLTGDFLSDSASATETFALAGKPDGLGLFETADSFYLFVNHELSNVETTYFNATSSERVNGARVSLIRLNKSWQPIGGRNLIESVSADGKTYSLNPTSGHYEAADATVLNGGTNLARFCSGYLAESGFVDENGDPAPFWFAPEERGSEGRGWAVGVDGVALALDGLGRYSKEQVLPASQYRADNATQTVMFSTEDTADGELYMFVGTQTVDDPNGFESGSLYVLRVKDSGGIGFDSETMPEDVAQVGTWTLVPEVQQLGTGIDLSLWVNDLGRSTNFNRLEDMHEDLQNPGTFYFSTTGTAAVENLYGKLHRLTLNSSDPTGDMVFETVLVGGASTGVSYDNIVVDGNGFVLLQEDKTAGGGTMMTTQQRHAKIWAYNIANDTAAAWFETDPAVGDPLFATQYGLWESSGIVETNVNSGLGLSSYVFDVQAHGLPTARFGEKGQILLAHANGGVCATPDGVTDATIVAGGSGVDLAWVSAETTNLWTHDTNPYFSPGADCSAAVNCTQIETQSHSDSFTSLRTYLLETENICGTVSADGVRLGQFQFSLVPGLP